MIVLLYNASKSRSNYIIGMKVTIYDNGILLYNDELNLYEKDYLKTETKSLE